MRLLIAGQERLYREGLARAFGCVGGYDVVGTASMSADVLQMATDLAPDVVLLDLGLQQMGALVRELADRSGKVVVLGVKEAGDAIMPVIEQGIAGYVAREGSIADMFAAVDSAARGLSVVSPRTVAGMIDVHDVGEESEQEANSIRRAREDQGARAARVAPRLGIALLGAIRLTWLGREIRLAGRNARALIAILALERRPRFREVIAADLWPELPEQEAASALRQALWLLRCGLSDAGIDAASVLNSDKEQLGLQPRSDVELDVASFESCLVDNPVRVEEAIDLYRGDLAEGINVECLARDRERLADQFEDALAEASRRRLAEGNLIGARDAALRLLRRDPLREEAHTVLIDLYGRAGSRSQVIRQYRRLRAILESELNVEPLEETEDAYRVAIRRATERSELKVVWAANSEPLREGLSRNVAAIR